MNILYLDPVVHTGTSMNYKYYDGVVDELVKRDDCEVYHHRGIIEDFSKVNVDADVVVFGLGWFNHKYFGEIKNLNVPTVCILFKPQNELSEKLSFCKNNNISKILTPVPLCKEFQKLTGISTTLFPYGFCPETFRNREGVKKEIDIGFSGALHENKHYPPGAFPVENIRTKIGDKLSSMDISVYWNSSDDRPSRIPDYEDYATKINSSKMWVATQAAYGDITPRYYEVLASGTLLICQKIPEDYREIFIPGENCIEFENDMSDLEEKILRYRDDATRKEIVDKALLSSEKHTWKNRAEDLMNCIRGIV